MMFWLLFLLIIINKTKSNIGVDGLTQAHHSRRGWKILVIIIIRLQTGREYGQLDSDGVIQRSIWRACHRS